MTRAVKRRRIIVENDSSENEDSNVAARRSSLNVNLSFTSNVSDPGASDSDCGLLLRKRTSEETVEEENEELTKTVGKRNIKNITSNDTATSGSTANATIINAGNRKTCKNKPSRNSRQSVFDMEKKEEQLNKSCIELQNAIINKTKLLSDSKLSKKTSEILTGCSSNIRQMNDENHENRLPYIKLVSVKNSEILLTGQHPVRVNSISKNTFSKKNEDNKASQNSDNDGSDYSQSIASTPKKANIETSVDKSTGKTTKQIIKIPVTRLVSRFTDNNFDNSMSEINPISTPENIRSNTLRSNEPNRNSKIPRASNELNNTGSPILSQGTRKFRISRLSLKRKLTTNAAESSRLSINESFINRSPLTCSSFLERPQKTCNESNLNQHTKTIILDEKNESSENHSTINLDENTKTINIDHSSSQSSMEITTISARTPIVREELKKICKSNQTSVNAINESIKKTNQQNSANTDVKDADQDDCSVNTVRTSLNVNTSLDNVSLAERVIQKENKRPGETRKLVNQTSKNNFTRSSQTLTTMRSSLCVNTSLDSIRKSSDSSKTDCEQERREDIRLQPTTSDNNQEIEKNTERRSNRRSNGTARSSMHMNTSLDSVQKSPNTREPLNYNKMLSLVEEASYQSPDNDSETEQMPLLERIQMDSVAKIRKRINKQDVPKEIAETSKGKLDSKRTSNKHKSLSTTAEKSRDAEKNESKRIRKSSDFENDDLQESDSKNSESTVRSKSSKKSRTNSAKKNSTASESSIVEPTPFPASRSLLFKTIIKNNIAMNTLNPRRLVDSSDDDERDGPHLSLSKKTNASPKKRNNVHDKTATLSDDSTADTVVVNSSDESSTESNRQKERVAIEESLNDTENPNISKINKHRKSTKQRVLRNSDSSDEEEENRKVAVKRKLYPLRENSQISFSPTEMSQSRREPAPKEMKRKKRKKRTPKKEESIEKPTPESVETSDQTENEVSIKEPEKKKKKPRKIKSKKIVVKKVNNLTLLDNMLENDGEASSTNERNSLREFDLRKAKNTRKEKYHKFVLVVTGYDKESKDLVKSVIKSLGSATLQANVTPRTTHVISSGVRTINLLKGIIRGCWLLQLEWALKSLESEKWLDPSPYEMSHFAKAVQINRRDRKIFGKGYVPELFITCGPIYIENGTTPPAAALKELVKTAGGSITENPDAAKIIVGMTGLKENWILDSITTGEVQSFDQYRRNQGIMKI